MLTNIAGMRTKGILNYSQTDAISDISSIGSRFFCAILMTINQFMGKYFGASNCGTLNEIDLKYLLIFFDDLTQNY